MFLSRCGSAAFGLRGHLILPIFLGTQDRAMIGCVGGEVYKREVFYVFVVEGKERTKVVSCSRAYCESGALLLCGYVLFLCLFFLMRGCWFVVLFVYE